MKKESISNDCQNCAYFVKHFANLHGSYYWVPGCLHCVNTALTAIEQRKRMHNLVACEHWQPMQIQVEEREESIKHKLLYICNLLEDIAQILKEDTVNVEQNS